MEVDEGGERGHIAELRALAAEAFDAAVEAADPRRAVLDNLRRTAAGQPVICGEEIPQGGELRIVAFGKAAVTMARAAMELLTPAEFTGPGVVSVNPENSQSLERFQVYAAGHPLPDPVGLAAATAVERYLAPGGESDATLILISGGGSALLASPAAGIRLEDKIETSRLLLACGAPIGEINCVRKHLSLLKGGGLARLSAPARVESLILSDVVGDDLGIVASGPTVADETTFLDALGVLTRYDLVDSIPGAVLQRLGQGVAGKIADTAKRGDPIFARVENRLVGSNGQSLAAAREWAREHGFAVEIFSSRLQGEARIAAAELLGTAGRSWDGERPLAILAGGETTVTQRGGGMGGRNQEMALAFALACEAEPLAGSWAFLSGDTDGRDGPTDAAGGLVDAGTLARIRRAGLDPATQLDDNNSYEALAAAADLLVTGPTGTNVADLQILLLAADGVQGRANGQP